jgi:hypothetical protein
MRRKSLEEIVGPEPSRSDRVLAAERCLTHVKHMHATGAATLGDVCDVHSDYARERVDAADVEELHRLEKSGELQGWMDAAGYEDGEDPDQVEARREGVRARVHAHLIGRPAPRREAAVSNAEPVDHRSPDEQLADYTARYNRKSTRR